MNNREWLKSLSDRQLDKEIKYGGWLTEGFSHREFHTRALQEAREEKQRRSEANRYD
jgi:hypothetical protein